MGSVGRTLLSLLMLFVGLGLLIGRRNLALGVHIVAAPIAGLVVCGMGFILWLGSYGTIRSHKSARSFLLVTYVGFFVLAFQAAFGLFDELGGASPLTISAEARPHVVFDGGLLIMTIACMIGLRFITQRPSAGS